LEFFIAIAIKFIFCNIFRVFTTNIKKTKMKKHEVHILKQDAGFSTSMKEELSQKVEAFLNKKSSMGYEVINVSFTYYETAELIAFVTICK
jgi:uncharacterized protein YpmS